MTTTTTKRLMRVQLRWQIHRDVPAVRAIEQQCFDFPWSSDEFFRCLRERAVIPMVAEHDQHVVGYMIYRLTKSDVHLLNFAVACRYQRRGVGSQMLANLIAKMQAQQRSGILAEVRETNLGAQVFLRACDFRWAYTLPGHYEDTDEDAYLMQHRREEP